MWAEPCPDSKKAKSLDTGELLEFGDLLEHIIMWTNDGQMKEQTTQSQDESPDVQSLKKSPGRLQTHVTHQHNNLFAAQQYVQIAFTARIV